MPVLCSFHSHLDQFKIFLLSFVCPDHPVLLECAGTLVLWLTGLWVQSRAMSGENIWHANISMICVAFLPQQWTLSLSTTQKLTFLKPEIGAWYARAGQEQSNCLSPSSWPAKREYRMKAKTSRGLDIYASFKKNSLDWWLQPSTPNSQNLHSTTTAIPIKCRNPLDHVIVRNPGLGLSAHLLVYALQSLVHSLACEVQLACLLCKAKEK